MSLPYLGLVLEPFMTELNLKNPAFETINILRSFKYIEKEYRCLINKCMMEIVGLVLVFSQAMLSQFCVYCNFAVVRHWRELDTHVAGNHQTLYNHKILRF